MSRRCGAVLSSCRRIVSLKPFALRTLYAPRAATFPAGGDDLDRCIRELLAAIPACASLAIDASALEAGRRYESGRVTAVFHARELTTANADAVRARAAQFRGEGVGTALADVRGTPDEISGVLSHAFDEVWLDATWVRELPLGPTPARGLLREIVDLLQRRSIHVIALGLQREDQLSGAIDLGLAGAAGQLFGDDAARPDLAP